MNKINAFKNAIFGDIIGFGNGDIKHNHSITFNRGSFGEDYKKVGADYSNELLWEFIHKGGLTGIKAGKMRMSINSYVLLMLHNMEDLSKLEGELVKLGEQKHILHGEANPLRFVSYLKKAGTYRAADITNDPLADENMALVFAAVIAVDEYGSRDLVEKIVDAVIKVCPNHRAVICGIIMALFIKYIHKKRSIHEWIKDAIHVIENERLVDFIRGKYPAFVDGFTDERKKVISKLNDYVEDRFGNRGVYKKNALTAIPNQRMYYYAGFGTGDVYFPARGCLDCLIICYDLIQECGSNWEKLIFMSCIHSGDSAITGFLCNFMHGFMHRCDEICKIIVDKSGIII